LCSFICTSWMCTLSLHVALPIFGGVDAMGQVETLALFQGGVDGDHQGAIACCFGPLDQGEVLCRVRLKVQLEPKRRRRALGNVRSEEHTSELQSRENIVCRLLLE